MDVAEAIRTRIEVREYTGEPIPDDVKRAILDAARLAPSGKNLQHWSFILIEDDDDLAQLAELSTTGSWVADADFGVVVVTDPDYYYNRIDAGRAVTHMQFAAWEHGVGSCIFTGYDDEEMREFLDVPESYDVSLVAGFGHPPFDIEELRGEKDRRGLKEIAYRDRFGEPLDLD